MDKSGLKRKLNEAKESGANKDNVTCKNTSNPLCISMKCIY